MSVVVPAGPGHWEPDPTDLLSADVELTLEAVEGAEGEMPTVAVLHLGVTHAEVQKWGDGTARAWLPDPLAVGIELTHEDLESLAAKCMELARVPRA